MRVNISVLFLILEEKLLSFLHWKKSFFLFFTHSKCEFVINGHYHVAVCSLCTYLVKFIMNGCWILSKAFLHLLRWSCGFYPHFVNVVHHVDWFANIQLSLHPWNKSHLIMVGRSQGFSWGELEPATVEGTGWSQKGKSQSLLWARASPRSWVIGLFYSMLCF